MREDRAMDEPQASDWSTRKRCDHICLLDDEHVERGEVHQYGYEIPSPRLSDDKPNLGLATTRELLDELRTRIEVDYYVGGGGLDYSTVNGRPGGNDGTILIGGGDDEHR